MAFEDSCMRLMLREGGLENDASDPGGMTKYGISKRSFPDVDIANLTMDQAEKIYKAFYWDKLNLDRLPPSVADKVFDMAVNCGNTEAVILLQRAIRANAHQLEEDGILGNRTALLASSVHSDTLIAAMRSEQAGFYRLLVAGNQTLGKFLEGWLNRAYGV